MVKNFNTNNIAIISYTKTYKGTCFVDNIHCVKRIIFPTYIKSGRELDIFPFPIQLTQFWGVVLVHCVLSLFFS